MRPDYAYIAIPVPAAISNPAIDNRLELVIILSNAMRHSL